MDKEEKRLMKKILKELKDSNKKTTLLTFVIIGMMFVQIGYSIYYHDPLNPISQIGLAISIIIMAILVKTGVRVSNKKFQ